ncbi:MAG TPA: GAF domain-containing protein, partial [Ktedonobacteraceae bacterium]|nr:GAF domain-containing protein [Ktedonobacteraceae bacterium]
MEARTQSPTLEESTIVERVARIVSSVRGAKSNYAHLASELEPAIPFDIFGIALLRHDRQAVRVTVCKRKGNSWLAQHHLHPIEDSMVERILSKRATSAPENLEFPGEELAELIIQNYPTGLDGTPAQSGDALSGNPHLRATLIAPLVVADRVLGTLELGSIRPNAYADETLQRLIGAVVRVLAAAIESAQVGGSVEIQDRQRQELKDVSSALTSDMDLSMILSRIVAGIAKALNVASAIVTLDQQSGSLHLRAQSGLDEAALQRVIAREEASSELSILGFTLHDRQPCVSQNIAEDKRFPLSITFASELAICSIFVYPLVIGSTVYGFLLLCSPEPGGFTPLKADILSLFAGQASIAIHNGMLLESARGRRRFQEEIEQLESLQSNTILTTGTEDEQALLQHIREESQRIYGLSFSNLLRIISDNMLTLNERNILRNVGVFPLFNDTSEASTWLQHYEAAGNEHIRLQEEQTISLAQTVEASLARAGLLGDVGAALGDALDPNGNGAKEVSFQSGVGYLVDPLFVVDLHGRCIYVTPAAEVFCGMRLYGSTNPFVNNVPGVLHPASFISLQEAFMTLLPRIRNANEVLTYLQAFTHENIDQDDDLLSRQHTGDGQGADFLPDEWSANTLRCIIAAEPIQKKSPLHFYTADDEDYRATTRDRPYSDESDIQEQISQRILLDSAPSDHHYQLKRYSLYDSEGQLIAHALQVQDITEQVRDEKNRSALLSAVSHDLRTPLTTIKAAVTGLMQPGIECDEKMLHEILEEIDIETDHLDTLVNSLVEMSRIQMGALVLDKEWCDVAEIVHTTLSRMERLLDGRLVRTLFQPQLPLIQADYVQLGRVFRNLIENAVRYSPAGTELCISLDMVSHSGRLDASVGTTFMASQESIASQRSIASGDGAFLRAQVVDRGSGVPARERERIFKPFYSLDPKNSGLGLAICCGIVEAHQGRIWVEPASQGGSC